LCKKRDNLVNKYLNYKTNSGTAVKQQSHIKNVLNKAIEEWGGINIKDIGEGEIEDIGEGEIEDFLFKDFGGISNKTRHNYKSVLSDFWTWVVRREKRKNC